jgi:hypothetical protein
MVVFALLAFLRAVLVRGGEIAFTNRHAAYYAITSILVFWLLYQLLGMDKHFEIPPYLKGRERSPLTSLYTAVLAQSNAMPDTVPKTNLARVFFMMQVSIGWMWFLLFT